MLRSLRSTTASARRISATTRASYVVGDLLSPPLSRLQPSHSFHVSAQEHQFLPSFRPITSPIVSACLSTEAAKESASSPTEIVVELVGKNRPGRHAGRSPRRQDHQEMMRKITQEEEQHKINVVRPSWPTSTELYEEMRKSVEETRSMPANVNLLSLVDNCNNREDIKLLFQILEKLRVFRLSNLRIHDNFNCHLCWRISKACIRSDAVDYGLKALWKHNVYGLTPSVGSAHCFLLHAKRKNDVKLMVKIMQVMSKNSLPLQAGTADIVFSICYNANDWNLLSKYARRFLKAKVKLRRTTFGIWMDFAANNGDVKSIWKIEELRSKTVNKHTVASVFSCAKGFLLEHNPESAAAVVNLFYQGLPDEKKQSVADELHQLLVGDWVKKVAKRLKKEDTKEQVESLRTNISVMAASLSDMGIDAKVNLEEVKC